MRAARQLGAGRRGARVRLGPGATGRARAGARAGGPQHAVGSAVGVESGKKSGDRRWRGRRPRRGDLAESANSGGDRLLHAQLGELYAAIMVAETDLGLAVLVRNGPLQHYPHLLRRLPLPPHHRPAPHRLGGAGAAAARPDGFGQMTAQLRSDGNGQMSNGQYQ
jgi:hypothetical protein